MKYIVPIYRYPYYCRSEFTMVVKYLPMLCSNKYSRSTYRLVNSGGSGGSGRSTVGRELSAGAVMTPVDAIWSTGAVMTAQPAEAMSTAAAAAVTNEGGEDDDVLFLAVAAATAWPAFRLSRNNRSRELPIRRTHVTSLLLDASTVLATVAAAATAVVDVAVVCCCSSFSMYSRILSLISDVTHTPPSPIARSPSLSHPAGSADSGEDIVCENETKTHTFIGTILDTKTNFNGIKNILKWKNFWVALTTSSWNPQRSKIVWNRYLTEFHFFYTIFNHVYRYTFFKIKNNKPVQIWYKNTNLVGCRNDDLTAYAWVPGRHIWQPVNIKTQIENFLFKIINHWLMWGAFIIIESLK